MRRTFLILLGAALLLRPATVRAQSTTPSVGDTIALKPSVDSTLAQPPASEPGDELPRGARVRFTSAANPADWIQGRLMEADSAAVTVQIGPAGRMMRVPRSSIVRFDVAAGVMPGGKRTARGVRHGARFGIAAMGALFLALAATDDHADDSAVSIAALIGVPITLGAAVAGMLVEPGTKWRPVPIPVRVGPAQELRGDEEAPVHAVRRHPAGAPGLRVGRSPYDPRP